MKKLLLLSALFIFACNSDDNDITPLNSQDLVDIIQDKIFYFNTDSYNGTGHPDDFEGYLRFDNSLLITTNEETGTSYEIIESKLFSRWLARTAESEQYQNNPELFSSCKYFSDFIATQGNIVALSSTPDFYSFQYSAAGESGNIQLVSENPLTISISLHNYELTVSEATQDDLDNFRYIDYPNCCNNNPCDEY